VLEHQLCNLNPVLPFLPRCSWRGKAKYFEAGKIEREQALYGKEITSSGRTHLIIHENHAGLIFVCQLEKWEKKQGCGLKEWERHHDLPIVSRPT
jgi:hypothetical protein